MTIDSMTQIDGKRGSGRTLAWVRSLPQEWSNTPFMLVVHTNAMAAYLRRMLHEERPDLKLVRVLVMSRTPDVDRLRGVRFEVDHAVWDTELLKPEARQLLRALWEAQRR